MLDQSLVLRPTMISIDLIILRQLSDGRARLILKSEETGVHRILPRNVYRQPGRHRDPARPWLGTHIRSPETFNPHIVVGSTFLHQWA